MLQFLHLMNFCHELLAIYMPGAIGHGLLIMLGFVCDLLLYVEVYLDLVTSFNNLLS